MNRSTLFITALALTLFAAAILWQRSGIRSMQREIQVLEATLNPVRSESTSLIEAHDTTPVPPKPTRQTVSEILELIPSQQEGTAMRFGAPKGLRAMPKLLEAFTSYTADDLFAVIEQLDSMEASADGKAATLKSLVFIVLADAVPERVLKLAERQNDQQLRAMAFPALARTDPQRAREILSNANWSRSEKQSAKTALMSVLINTDVPQALSLMHEDHADLDREDGFEVGMTLGLASDNEASRRDLWAAMGREENTVVSDKIMPGLVFGEFFRDGLPALRQAFEQLTVMEDSTKSALIKGAVQMGLDIMGADPTGAYEWMRESLSGKQFHETFANAVRSWARKDFNAAGAWLGSQPSSPERDAAMSTFARTVVSIDPEAAATWAASIDDEQARTSALDETLGHWKRKDANAVKEWEKRNRSDQE